jgi:hypothetical protein
MIDPVPPAAAPLDIIILWTFVIEGVYWSVLHVSHDYNLISRVRLAISTWSELMMNPDDL